jgi:hypothetical protein
MTEFGIVGSAYGVDVSDDADVPRPPRRIAIVTWWCRRTSRCRCGEWVADEAHLPFQGCWPSWLPPVSLRDPPSQHHHRPTPHTSRNPREREGTMRSAMDRNKQGTSRFHLPRRSRPRYSLVRAFPDRDNLHRPPRWSFGLSSPEQSEGSDTAQSSQGSTVHNPPSHFACSTMPGRQ